MRHSTSIYSSRTHSAPVAGTAVHFLEVHIGRREGEGLDVLSERHSVNRFTRMSSGGVGSMPFTTTALVRREQVVPNRPGDNRDRTYDTNGQKRR
jgi:hypothetical protein